MKSEVVNLPYKPFLVYFLKKKGRTKEKAVRKGERISVVPLYIFRRMASLCRLESRIWGYKPLSSVFPLHLLSLAAALQKHAFVTYWSFLSISYEIVGFLRNLPVRWEKLLYM